MDKDFAPLFNELLSSPVGKELLRELDALSNQKYREAGKVLNLDKGYGLTNQAEGIMMAIEHLHSLAYLPKDEGSKASK